MTVEYRLCVACECECITINKQTNKQKNLFTKIYTLYIKKSQFNLPAGPQQDAF